MRLTVGLCIRWRAINNRLGGVCAVKEGKVEQLFRKRPSHGIPCKACVWFGRKGRVPLENRGKCLTHLTDLSPCVPMSGQDVYLQAVCGTKCSLAFFFRVWPEEKTCVVTNVPLGGTPPAEMVSFGKQQDEVGTGLKSFTVSQPGNSEV